MSRCWPWRCKECAGVRRRDAWHAQAVSPHLYYPFPSLRSPLERSKDFSPSALGGSMRVRPLCVHVKCYLVVQLAVRSTHTHTRTHTNWLAGWRSSYLWVEATVGPSLARRRLPLSRRCSEVVSLLGSLTVPSRSVCVCSYACICVALPCTQTN